MLDVRMAKDERRGTVREARFDGRKLSRAMDRAGLSAEDLAAAISARRKPGMFTARQIRRWTKVRPTSGPEIGAGVPFSYELCLAAEVLGLKSVKALAATRTIRVVATGWK